MSDEAGATEQHGSISLGSSSKKPRAGEGLPGAAWMEHTKFIAICQVSVTHVLQYTGWIKNGISYSALQSTAMVNMFGGRTIANTSNLERNRGF